MPQPASAAKRTAGSALVEKTRHWVENPCPTPCSRETFLSAHLTIISLGAKVGQIVIACRECGHVSTEPVLVHRARRHVCLPGSEKGRGRGLARHADTEFPQH